MPVTPTYPGVYIQEIPSGVRTITGVGTSITAFIGRTKRGPSDKAITINSYGDFERVFGGLWKKSTLGFAVRDFYLNGGSQAVIVRLFNPSFATTAERTTATSEAQTAADAVANAATTAAGVAGATPQAVAQAARGAVAAAGAASQFAMDAAEAVAKAAEEAEKVTSSPPSAASVAQAATNTKAAAVAKAVPDGKASVTHDGLGLEAAYEGEWGNAVRVRVDHDVSQSAADAMGVQLTDLFNLTVRDTKTGVTEVFRNLTTNGPRLVKGILENESRILRLKGTPPTARPAKHTDAVAGKDPLEYDSTSIAMSNPGSDGKDLTKDSFTGTGKEVAKIGLFALEDTDLFNLLCVPPYKNGDIENGLIDECTSYCEKRRAMLLIDPPSGWNTKDKAKSGIGSDVGSPHKNAAVFFPRLRQPNPIGDSQIEEFVPCGAVAGLFARTDTQRGVWKAPAGLEATLVGVPQLSVLLTDPENGELNQIGINCLRTMPAAGRVVWGARTRVGDDRLASEWKYIPVRRTALFIEESLYRGTQWVVFEPNDEPLWAQIRLNIGAFMQNLFRQGAFQGKTSAEAYFVKCDRETTTQNDINLGVVNITVGFAPLKPAEFVIISLQQMAGQIQT